MWGMGPWRWPAGRPMIPAVYAVVCGLLRLSGRCVVEFSMPGRCGTTSPSVCGDVSPCSPGSREPRCASTYECRSPRSPSTSGAGRSTCMRSSDWTGRTAPVIRRRRGPASKTSPMRSARPPRPRWSPRRPQTGSAMVLRFGAQLDVKEIRGAGDGEVLTDRWWRGTWPSTDQGRDVPGLVHDRRLLWKGHADTLPLLDHAKTLMNTSWWPAGDQSTRICDCGLWGASARVPGARGHPRAASTPPPTRSCGRHARLPSRSPEPVARDAETVTESVWLYHHSGHIRGRLFAAGIAQDAAVAREANRDARLGGEAA